MIQKGAAQGEFACTFRSKLSSPPSHRRGLIVRHLVMPGRLADTRKIMQFIAQEISPTTYVNVMGQYRPAHLAAKFPELNRPLKRSEYHEALSNTREAGLNRFAD